MTYRRVHAFVALLLVGCIYPKLDRNDEAGAGAGGDAGAGAGGGSSFATGEAGATLGGRSSSSATGGKSGGTTAKGSSSAKGGTTAKGGSSANGGTTTNGGTTANGGTTTTGTAGSGCTGGHEVRTTNNVCTPVLVTVGTAGATFGIDATEVTRGQYESWLATSPSVTSGWDTRDVCGRKADFNPGNAACLSNRYSGTNADKHPMVCVDWCDSFAYCAAVGKRLCGNRAGGASPVNDPVPTNGQWYAACSAAGTTPFPYGATFEAQRCNGRDTLFNDTAKAASFTGCTSTTENYVGLFDLLGNVFEWLDSCWGLATAETECRSVGGSWAEDLSGVTCASVSSGGRFVSYNNLGFRCCSQ